VADLSKLKRIVDIEYNDITRDSSIYHDKLRVFIRDGSNPGYLVFKEDTGSLSYHWERRQIDGKIYRHDNFPDPQWKGISTFPKHFHNGSQNKVQESKISDDPATGTRGFMDFIL